VQGNQYRKGEDIFLGRESLLSYMRDAGAIGVRSIALIGEAEPLLNPHVYEAIEVGKKAGVDMALGTNGILYDTGAAGEKALEYLTYLRFNISAADHDAYRRVHASKDFEKLMEKVAFVVETRKRNNLPLTVGFQMVLTPQDADQMLPLARLGKKMGIDYFEIKHCGDTVNNDLGIFKVLATYDRFKEDLEAAEQEATDDYRVIVKWKNITSQGKRTYDQCLGAPFLIYTSGDGLVYPCGQFFSYREDEFRMGDLKTQSFRAIVESDRYWEVVDRVKNCVDVHKECYSSCKTNAINDFLFMLKDPPKHINFI
jgi:radical SAM protein with 4Fe4S-binding SPASM domain